jgi:hypothetical protein
VTYGGAREQLCFNVLSDVQNFDDALGTLTSDLELDANRRNNNTRVDKSQTEYSGGGKAVTSLFGASAKSVFLC